MLYFGGSFARPFSDLSLCSLFRWGNMQFSYMFTPSLSFFGGGLNVYELLIRQVKKQLNSTFCQSIIQALMFRKGAELITHQLFI